MEEANYTNEERDAVLAVRSQLLAAGVPRSKLGELELITVTLVAKCRVAEAVEKFNTWQTCLLDQFGVDDLWSPSADRELEHQWHRLAVAGVDEASRQMMWIHGGGTQLAEERLTIWASALYFLAVHADLTSLRNGITLVIDTSNSPKKKVGNERRLQVAWQNFPVRPQHIFILGTTFVTRITVNAIIAFASLFAKNKVIQRIQFDYLARVGALVGKHNLPERHGGAPQPPTPEWVRQRLAGFPRMNLPSDA
jgi:hypothetical protein